MGGTFDPIHHGHLVAASEVQAWFDLDEVVFVPTGAPWQKADRDVTPAEDLFELARFVGCTRPGYTMDESTIASIPADRVTMVEIPALAISSTDCRERTRRGEPVWYLVPDGVVQYIAKHDLYPKDHA